MRRSTDAIFCLALGVIRAVSGGHEVERRQARVGRHSLHNAVSLRLHRGDSGRQCADVARGNAEGRAATARNARIRRLAKEARRRGGDNQV